MRAALAVALALALLAGCRERGPVAVIRGPGGAVEVALEVAATPAARARGLMYRTSLAEGHGMLFIFDEDASHGFWMKNTLIPLDMLFIARDGTVVGIHPNATPLSTADIRVGTPSRYVLEVPGGWAARHGVAAGARVELRGVGTISDRDQRRSGARASTYPAGMSRGWSTPRGPGAASRFPRYPTSLREALDERLNETRRMCPLVRRGRVPASTVRERLASASSRKTRVPARSSRLLVSDGSPGRNPRRGIWSPASRPTRRRSDRRGQP